MKSSSSEASSTQQRVDTEYKQSQKLILEIRHDLEQLEKEQELLQQNRELGHHNDHSTQSSAIEIDEMESGLHHRRGGTHLSSFDSIEKQQERQRLHSKVTCSINNLARCERNLRSLVVQLPYNKREMWKRQTEQVTDELSFLRSSINKLFKKVTDLERDRQLLLGASDARDDDDGPLSKEKRMKHLGNQHDSLKRSVALVEQMKDTGANVLSMLSQQRDTIQSVQRKVLDIGLTLGVSQSTLRMIERRNLIDKIIVYGGMIVVIILLLLVFYYKIL